MVDFIRKRLQVFVSSTFKDLVQERQAAVEAILTAGHIPAGMELFTSGDESQMDVIKQWIDESDVYLLILGGCYGSIEPKSGKSYTELEYEYALSKDKPLFACVIKEEALDQRVMRQGRSAIENLNPQKLKMFRDLALTKMVRFWEDIKDIKITVGETLNHISRRDDLVGWVRATEQANMPALADEIARLSKENSLLRSQLDRGTVSENINGLTFEQFMELIKSKSLIDEIIQLKKSIYYQNRNIYEIQDYEKVTELASLGLVTLISEENFTFTEAGIRIRNNLEYQKICDGNLTTID